MPADPLCQPIAHLHTRLRDVIAGYESLEERAEPEVASFARRMLALHRRHAGALSGMLKAMGCEASPSGSFMAVVQSGVIALRDWLGDLDEEVLPRVAEGERMLLDLYDEALEAAAGRGPERLVLLEQRRGLAGAVEAIGARDAA